MGNDCLLILASVLPNTDITDPLLSPLSTDATDPSLSLLSTDATDPSLSLLSTWHVTLELPFFPYRPA
jgi:hypothetical protein